MADFQEDLQNPVSDEQIIKEIEASNEKDYLTQIKKKNKEFLIDGLTLLEKERIAKYICDRYRETKETHNDICDNMDEYDDTYRMVRKSIPGDDGDMPNYTTPLSTVKLEVTHANIMNVFFTPKDVMQVLPTEEGDVPKVDKLSTFGNWSMDNEMDLFHGVDRLFHSSGKNGEAPYMVYWHKEYAMEFKREIIMNPADPSQPLTDPDTKEVIYQESEEPKLVYNAPKLEVFSRKDYRQPPSAMMGQKPPYEFRNVRITFDTYLKDMLQGKMYDRSIKDVEGWEGENSDDNCALEDYEGDLIPTDKWEQEFAKFYGEMRINLIKRGEEEEADEYRELSDEFIAIVHVPSQTLCQLRKNKFPLKQRPIGMDYFIPDDEGRRAGIGIMAFMGNIQKSYDALFNQFIFGTMQSNNPFGFFTPMGNQRNEPMQIKNGYLFPTSDPNSVNIIKMPPPDASIQVIMQLIDQQSQLLFGISDYAAGVESTIDPDAPAKKAEIVVGQGNVRLNLLIKRKNKTLQDIFRRWFLLYQANMPPNKFMRVVGDSKDNPWKFTNISISDFSLGSIPDFELTGNILNVNKTLEANKALATYNVLMQNPLFQPNTVQGLRALHSLTKWLIDKMDEVGLSRFIPAVPGEMIHTPEEENARFLQGDKGSPTEGEDHINHIKVHRQMLVDPTIPDEVKQIVVEHIKETVKKMQEEMTQQSVLSQAGVNPNQQQQQGAPNAVQQGTPGPTPGAPGRVVQPGRQ